MKAPKTPEIPFVSISHCVKLPRILITSQPNPIILGQDSNCAILRAHLKALGVQVELDTEMVTYEQDDTGVTATLKIHEREDKVRSKFLLGTDGAKGTSSRRT